MGKLFFSLLTLCAITVGIRCLGTGLFPDIEAKSSQAFTKEGQKKAMYQSIEEKARKANGADERLVRELADAVLDDAGITVIPADIRNNMKERLIRAELKYRDGKKGVHETAIVRLINDLADQFGAPDYAKATPLQVRTMRVLMQRNLPNFIGRENRKENQGLQKKVGDRINPEMSPFEAAYLASILIWQKMLNDDWQETPEKWTPERLNKRFEAADDSAPPQLAKMPNNEKRIEMNRVVSRGAANFKTTDDIASLVNSSLDILGIER